MFAASLNWTADDRSSLCVSIRCAKIIQVVNDCKLIAAMKFLNRTICPPFSEVHEVISFRAPLLLVSFMVILNESGLSVSVVANDAEGCNYYSLNHFRNWN